MIRYAAAIVVAVLALVAMYRLGERKGSQVSNVREQSLPNGSHVLEQQVGNLTQDGQALTVELRKRDRLIEDITNSRNRELIEIARLKEQEKNLQDAITKAGEREGHLASDRDTVTEQLKLAQGSLANRLRTWRRVSQGFPNDSRIAKTRLRNNSASLLPTVTFVS